MKRIQKYARVIFDFNGTLLDDVWLGIRTVNAMLRRRALPTIDSLDQYYRVFGFPIEDYYRRLGFDFAQESYDVLAHEWIDGYRREEQNVALRAGVHELLSYIAASQKPMYVLSATEEKMLREQMRDLQIDGFFEEIFGRNDIYAYDKSALAASLAPRFAEGKTLYVGDTDHDAESAAAMGAECILVTGGHQAREMLMKTSCTVLGNLEEVLSYLDEECEK